MSFIFDDKNLIETLVTEGDKFVRKYGQAAPPPPTDAQIRAAYQDYIKKDPQWHATALTSNRNNEQAVYDTFKTNYIQQQAYKQSVNNPVISPEALAAYQLAEKLALGLQSQIEPGSVKKEAPLDFNTPDQSAPALKPENAETLGDFLRWAAVNKVTWAGKRIAWDPKAEPDVRDPDAWVFQTYETGGAAGRARDALTREAKTVEFYANKGALVAFLSYLRDSEDTKKNKVLEVMLGSIIKESNKYLTKEEQLQDRPSDKPSDQFGPDEVVDGFRDSTINTKNMYDGIQEYMPDAFARAPIKLTYQDITSKAALMDWLSGMKVTGDDGKLYDPTAPESNPCPSIHALYSRAKYLASRATDRTKPKFSALENSYLRQITLIGREFSYQDQACAVTSPGTATQQPDQQKKDTGANAIAADRIFGQMMSFLPLSVDVVDFTRIRKFFELYKQFLAASNSPRKAELENTMASTETIMSGLTGILKDRRTAVPMANSYQVIVNMLEPPPGDKYLSFNRGLYSVVQNTGYAVQQLAAGYADKPNVPREKLEQQYSGTSSAMGQNLRMIQTYIDNLPNVISFK